MIANSYDESSVAENDFIAGFTARQDMIDTFRRRLANSGQNDFGDHHVLIGPSGSGKTSMLRRLEIEIRRDPVLSAHFIPLSFKGENHDSLALVDFWNTVIDALANHQDTCPDTESRTNNPGRDKEIYRNQVFCGDLFENQMSVTGKRVVLLIDDFDLILKSIEQKTDHWNLRRTLQARNGPVLIGAGEHAEYFFYDYDSAFYDFFHSTYLESPVPDDSMEYDPI